MLLRPFAIATVIALLGSGPMLAQTRVRTESIRPAAGANPPSEARSNAWIEKPTGSIAAPAPNKPAGPEIITDTARLPPAVARTRERILAAARSGDLQKLLSVMQANERMPIFTLSDEKNPLPFWRSTYPDSEGVEVLAILVSILEAGFVHVEKGTPQEIFMWPYFARMPLKDLTAERKVELFRIVTGSDYKDMLEFGAYNFYRLGIGPDGIWHFFVSGD